MAFTKKTPEGGRGRDTWSFVSTVAGEKWTGWLAGSAEWFLCHRVPTSKPCFACFTDGELKCSHCPKGWAPYWWGYVPIYRESDGKAVLIGVRDGMFDVLRGLSRGTPVQISRKDAETEAVGVSPLASGRTYVAYRPDRQHGPNLWPYLWRLWKLPELEAWWCANLPEGVEHAPLGASAAVSSESSPSALSPAAERMKRELEERFARAAAESAAAQQKAAAKVDALRNGKH